MRPKISELAVDCFPPGYVYLGNKQISDALSSLATVLRSRGTVQTKINQGRNTDILRNREYRISSPSVIFIFIVCFIRISVRRRDRKLITVSRYFFFLIVTSGDFTPESFPLSHPYTFHTNPFKAGDQCSFLASLLRQDTFWPITP